MYHVADTGALVRDGILTDQQAAIIRDRARATMVALALNTLLVGGIIAATGGLILWLASPLSVALSGGMLLACGLGILLRGRDLYRLFGNAATLIGAGMLAGGAGLELGTSYPDLASPIMLALGGAMAALAGRAYLKAPAALRFATGAVTLMGVALVIGGLGFAAAHYDLSGWPMVGIHAAVFAALVGAGWLLDLRIVTALAIVPFAQMLDTGTFYWHAMYAFYSPEPTLSILQLSALIAACLWLARRGGEVVQRQAGILAIMAFVVANLCFLVGSLWGDVVGETLWGPGYSDWDNYDQWTLDRDAFRASALSIREHVYSLVWAALLAGAAVWAAMTARRGLFNTAMTFAGIHAYTQAFETFGAEPLVFAIGGLLAIPLAWGLWRLNDRFKPTAP